MVGQIDADLSTGLSGLDRVLKGLIPGDNVVWQVDSAEEYQPFIEPYCRSAQRLNQKLIYFRFGKHKPLVPAELDAEVYHLHPEEGFETFLAEIHRVIEHTGHGGFYVFDCLSGLSADWYSDQMLGNFFVLTCPYLYDVEALAYFGLLRNHHSAQANAMIANTAQVVIDVYRHNEQLYVHPLKAQQRHSPTMYMLHSCNGDDFKPVGQSATTAEILTSVPRGRFGSSGENAGIWDRSFLQGEQLLRAKRLGEAVDDDIKDCFHRLVRMAITRDPRVFELVTRYMTLEDVLNIGKRQVGTGLIGGKSVGMLLARAILKKQDPRWCNLLEPHDSFYIGSDVFYTFIVQNGIWWTRQRNRETPTLLEGAVSARRNIIRGAFPADVEKQFEAMLDYFGQSPIIVRSSSLLEDNFGNAFAGKYESVFCANQGSRDKRLEDFKSAVRTIYASSMSDKALRYRAQRGLLDRDEQMALLVQRVSGSVNRHYFYPQAAGVGFSFNPYRWDNNIDPEAGMLRLVFGLGTRAVDRADDDYTRVVALNAPMKRPESQDGDMRHFSQRKVDVLDLDANQVGSRKFEDVAKESPNLPLEKFATKDHGLLKRAAKAKIEPPFPWVLTFNELLEKTDFVKDMRQMLRLLHDAYQYPVDVEFTMNFLSDDQYKIDVVQCRPLQVKGGGTVIELPRNISEKDVVFEAAGAVIGQSRLLELDRIVFVSPVAYGQLPVPDRYAVARLIGQIVKKQREIDPLPVTLLMGPGRWGTTTPSLGVPAAFNEINSCSALCEIVAMREDLVPDVSLGTHYFSDLVEMDILYLALFPGKENNALNHELLAGARNRLSEFSDDAGQWEEIVRVIDAEDIAKNGKVLLNANALSQRVVCYRDGEKPSPGG